MDSVTGAEMAIAMEDAGGLGIYTRHIGRDDELELQIEAVKKIKSSVMEHVAIAIGVKCNVEQRVKTLVDMGANIICLDAANGNHVMMLKAIETVASIKNKNPHISIIAGNVVTPMACQRLINAGAGALRIGMGSGAICSTRLVTGFGVPQLTAVYECAGVIHSMGARCICDGGMRNTGDVAKAIWAGADTVMLGYMLSGHDQCPDVQSCGENKKTYRGMASRSVSGRDDVAAEGVSINVRKKGDVRKTVKEIAAGLRSACTFANAMNLKQFRENIRAIRVSTLSNEETDTIPSI
jgi:IMP dehydrogenase